MFYHTIPYAEGKKYYEIDFVIPDRHKISPVEVKSSGYKTHKSLDEFCSKFSDRIMNKYLIYTKDYRRENGVGVYPGVPDHQYEDIKEGEYEICVRPAYDYLLRDE